MNTTRSWFNRVRTGALCVSAGLCLAAATPIALAQPDGGDAKAKPARTSVLTLDVAGLDGLLADPKDQGLKRVVSLIPARLKDLPSEVPAFQEAIEDDGAPLNEIFTLLGWMMDKPTRLALEYDMNNQDEVNRFGAGIQLSFGARDEADAKAAGKLLGDIIKSIPEEIDIEVAKDGPWAGMNQIETPAGHARFGPRKDAGGWRYEINFGRPGAPDKVFPALKPVKPAIGPAFTPYMRVTFDLSPLTPLVNMFAGGAAGDPAVAGMLSGLADSGLIGDEAILTEMYAGYSETASVSYTVTRGAGRFMEATGQTKTPLSEAELRVIPADASMASIVKFDSTVAVKAVRELVEQQEEVGEGLALIKRETGVDLVEDLLASVGGVMGAYMADSTGGGTLGSGVLFLQLKDAPKFQGAIAKFVDQLNRLLADKRGPNGYIAIRPWTHDGQTLHSLQFPGLPVPVEITYGFGGEWFVLAFNPQAAVGALRQAAGKGDKGLMSNADVAALFPKGQGFQAVSYFDTARHLKTGYPILTMCGSFLSNAVRSPKGADPSREVGLVVPLYNDLAKGVRPGVSYTFWSGDDLVAESQGDRSVLVNLGAGLGAVVEFAPAGLVLAGVVALAEPMAQARDRAMWEAREQMAEPAPVAPGRPNF